MKLQIEERKVRLSKELQKRDLETYSHSFRVSQLVERFCFSLGIPKGETSLFVAATLLHDIGKIKFSDAVLFSNTKLTNEQLFTIKMHPIIGAEILEHNGCHQTVVQCVLYHHERWDGFGYPDGLTNNQIPLGSRIIMLCDCVDVICHEEQYQAAMNEKHCQNELRHDAGGQFDPKLVEVFLENWSYIMSE